DEMVCDRFPQALVELVDGALERDPALRLELEAPVRRDLDAALREHEKMAGRHLPNALEHRARSRHDSERQIFVQRVGVELGQARLEREQRLDLGSKREALAVMPIVERLLAEVIAREQQAPPREVVECECKHSAETLEPAFAVPR